ncbi:zinc-ribbon domain-containing protein [Candidatus Pelagibacter bacterium]|nr:zinc-ribbon domain-containing protein [Candidatus Pelagibacter bacterium]
MILSCNSCEKKFVVPDQAIKAEGRTVQCGSCGNKWKQFPVKNEINKSISLNKTRNKKISSSLKIPKVKKKTNKRTREVSLYSPEYLAKKHGINLDNIVTNNNNKSDEKISFGFYNSLIIFIVVIIAFSKSLHFFQEFIILKMPFAEFYLNYFFESIKNILEIGKNLVSNR